MARYFYWDKKTTVEAALDLSIYWLNKQNLLNGHAFTTLTWTSSGSGRKSSVGLWVQTKIDPHVQLTYTKTDREGNKKNFDCKVPLTTTPCNFGGVRYWFCCPDCGQRVGCLYLDKEYFTCRTCANLTYDSRNESRLGRPGGIGYFLILENMLDKLYRNLKRRYYAGRPTRKYRQVLKLQNRMDSIDLRQANDLFTQALRK